jgi:hypothetical protein
VHNLGNSDHNLVLLEPKYRPIVLREKPRVITVQQWNTEGLDSLQASFDCTDWEVFITACESMDELTETVSDYVDFCVQLSIATKEVKVYPNNKLWITSEINQLSTKRKRLLEKVTKSN